MQRLLTIATNLGKAGMQSPLTIATDNGKAGNCYHQRQGSHALAADSSC